jgi:cytochrome P450
VRKFRLDRDLLHVLSLPAGGIFHDPEVFEEPSVFNPGRWLKEDLAHDRSYDLAFGGARVSFLHSSKYLK